MNVFVLAVVVSARKLALVKSYHIKKNLKLSSDRFMDSEGLELVLIANVGSEHFNFDHYGIII